MEDVFDMTDPVSPTKKAETPKDSILSRLREKLTAVIENEEVQIEVPKRPGVTLVISPNISQAEVKQWRRKAGENPKTGVGFDPNKFAAVIIASTCRGIFLDGEEVTTDEGDPVTFATPFVKEWMDAFDPFDAVKKMYGLDPHMEAAAGAILDASGYGDEVNVVDPTKAS